MMQPEAWSMARPIATEDGLLERLEQEIGNRNFEHWFRDKTTLRVEEDRVLIGVGSPFMLGWFQRHFRTPIARAVQSVCGAHARIEIQVDPQAAQRSAHASKADKTTNGAKRPNGSPSAGGLRAQKKRSEPGRSGLSRKPAASNRSSRRRRFADLADFVEGPSNQLPLLAAQQVCQEPGGSVNPLFLYGGVGTGKTHLLEGIYRRIRRLHPGLQVMYLTSEGFTNAFTEALRQHTLPGFRQRFRSLDVLLIDDVEFFGSKRVIQEEFLHTFKQLEQHGGQIVLAGDRHPRLLTELRDELTTRFLSGMVCRIENPDLETRSRIVQAKAERLRADIAPEALQFVAERFRNNVRELEGALHCLATYHRMAGKRITAAAARRMLADLERDCIRLVRLSDIERTVCGFFGIAADELKSARRHRSVSRPRMLAMFLARKLTGAAYSEIGNHFGGRNHSTVISAERQVRDWLKSETSICVASQTWPLADVLEALEQQVLAG